MYLCKVDIFCFTSVNLSFLVYATARSMFDQIPELLNDKILYMKVRKVLKGSSTKDKRVVEAALHVASHFLRTIAKLEISGDQQLKVNNYIPDFFFTRN